MENATSHMDNHPEIMAQVLDILGWSEQGYYEYQFEAGIKYLESYLPNDPAGQQLLKGDRLFWNWWKNHWYARDEAFVRDACCCPRSLAIDLYHYLNDADELTKEIHPSRVVVGDQFETEKII